MQKNSQEIKAGPIRWVNIVNPNKNNTAYLKSEFSFNTLDLEDVLSKTPRSKVVRYPNYFFMVLLFPVYNRQNQEITSSEIDIFCANDYLITVQEGNLPPLNDFFQICQNSTKAQADYFKNSQYLLYVILKKLFDYCYPMIDNINWEISGIEEKIFKGQEKEMTAALSETRRNVIDLRKILQSHKNTLQKIKKTHKEEALYSLQNGTLGYFDDLIDMTKEIWDQLEGLRESIEALQQTNESMISFKLNDVMKILTVFSVIILPATFVGTLFGMNSEFVPFAEHPLGFYAMFSLAFLSAILTLIYIWRKKWL